jgi:lysine 6-dehydrogenase
MKILVLGAGRMGLGTAFDLAHNSPDVTAVTVADHDAERANAVAAAVGSKKVTVARVDAGDGTAVRKLMTGHQAAISCVNYWYNADLAQAAIDTRVNFCDLGGNNTIVDRELALNDAAVAAGINIIPDCGLAPGMVSILAEHGAARFNKLESIRIRVGGLPQDPQPPLNYQIVFAVEGLINEYVERARVIRGGAVVEVDSMTELERLDFPAPYGELEAFQTSGGTSTLVETFLGRVQELDYKTIRYPGHCDRFKTMLDLGLAGSLPIEAGGVSVAPRKVFGECLLRSLPADEPDLVFVRLEYRGAMDEGTRTLRYDIIDKFDPATKLSAMMRTTAFPASIIAQMMARGDTLRRGATPQEVAIPAVPFVAELERRKIKIIESLVN